MLSFWVKKTESELMKSPMQLPVYKEGDDSVVELIKSYLGQSILRSSTGL
jgi:hypothetical protein